ncbi:hypothetical protein D3C75_632740 [compost metagenome]
MPEKLKGIVNLTQEEAEEKHLGTTRAIWEGVDKEKAVEIVKAIAEAVAPKKESKKSGAKKEDKKSGAKKEDKKAPEKKEEKKTTSTKKTSNKKKK